MGYGLESKVKEEMYELCERLFPICRSITGDGVRTTLQMLVEVYGHTLEEKIFEEFNQIRDIWKDCS